MARLIPRKQIEEQQNISSSFSVGQDLTVGRDVVVSGSLFVSQSFFLVVSLCYFVLNIEILCATNNKIIFEISLPFQKRTRSALSFCV